MSTIIAILLLQSIFLMWIDGNRFAGARSLADSDSDVVDCSEFKDDLDVISRFPFSVAVDPDRFSYGISYVRTYPNESHSIQEIHINHESVVPPSVVCLRNLRQLLVDTTPFHKNIVPDQLADMKKLRYFFCYSSPIVQMTPRLSTMTTLEMFECLNCQLKTLPDFSNLRKLWSVGVSYNQMKELRGLQNLRMLDIQANQFEEIPRIANKSSVNFLTLSNNPLKDFYPIWSYPNLEGFQVADTELKSLPTYIDKLAHLDYIDVSNNKLTHLPRTILNLGKLKEVAIQNNAFSETELQAIRENFEKYRPFIRLVTEDDSKPSEENSSNKHA